MNTLMAKFILRRVLIVLITVVIVSFVIFFLTSLLPGDVAQILLGQAATPEAVAALRHSMHLDQAAPLRFLHWLVDLVRGDMGVSQTNGMPIGDLIAQPLKNSLRLAGITALIAVPFSLCVGILSAMFRNSLFDRVISVSTVAFISLPDFMLATLAVLIFSVKLHWLPALAQPSQQDGIWELIVTFIMPVATLTFSISAQMIRMTRASVIETLYTPYVEMALLKGASRWRIVLRHALPNTIGPIANSVALALSNLLGGIIIVETIFSYPGISGLMLNAVSTRDMPLIQACAIIFCITYLICMVIADIISIISNPRLR